MKSRGLSVQCRIRGLNGEKLLNEIRRAGIPLQGVRRDPGRSLVLRCAASDYETIRKLAQETGYDAGPPEPVGLLRRLKAVCSRRGLVAGAALCAALMVYALGFVWHIRIVHAGPYEGEVRTFLQEQGITPWIRRSRVKLSALREQLEWRLPQVKWVRASWQGVALEISLEEGTPPPDIQTAGGSGDVVAKEDGLLVLLTVFSGTPKAKNGDFVRAGQVLIEGKEKGPGGGMIPVKARGSARARVWRTARVRMPLTEWLSTPTGRQAVRREIVAPFFSYCGQETPDYLTAEREIEMLPLGGVWLPLRLKRETIREVALEKGARDAQTVTAEAEKAAFRQLNQVLKNAETVDKWINFRMIEGDTIVVEAAGEMIREIGRFRKNTDGE